MVIRKLRGLEVCDSRSCGLGTTSASASIAATSSSLREAAAASREGTTAIALVVGGTSATPHAAALDVRVRAGLHAALLDDDTLISNLMRVGIEGSLVAFGRLEVDESTVLFVSQ